MYYTGSWFVQKYNYINPDIADKTAGTMLEGNMSGNGLLRYLTTNITSMVKNRSLCSMAIRVNVYIYVNMR